MLNIFKKLQFFLIATVVYFVITPTTILAQYISGDINRDGVVNLQDYVLLSNSFGTSNSASDINNDGIVNLQDYVILSNNFGRSASTPTFTPTPEVTLPPSSGVLCSSLSGIERRFPCSPLVVGDMPEKTSSTGVNSWAMFTNTSYPGVDDNNGVNERFSAVSNPNGSGVVVKNQNLLSDSDGHTTVGTGRSLPLGTTECSAFRWLWKNQSEFTQQDWVLVWQLQMQGSPIVAVSVDKATGNWFYKSRNGSDSGLDITLSPVRYGSWAYFVACTHLADAPNGWTKIWFSHDAWPDVNASPNYQRSGHDTYQGETGHNTIGIYAGGSGSVNYYGYFDRYGRATTPQRAVQIAGNP